MNKPQSTIGAVEADGVERQHRDQLFSLDRLCAAQSDRGSVITTWPLGSKRRLPAASSRRLGADCCAVCTGTGLGAGVRRGR